MSINQSTKRKLRNPIHHPTPEQMNEQTKEEYECTDCYNSFNTELNEHGDNNLCDECNVEYMRKNAHNCVKEGCDLCETYLEDEEEEEEEEGQNCRRCRTFVYDGDEYVLEGDCHAYCKKCFEQVVEEQEEEEEIETE